MTKSENDNIIKLQEIFYEYSIQDVATALFVMDLYPLNASSSLKMSFLWEVLRHSDPSKFRSRNVIGSYSQFSKFIEKTMTVCPSYPTVEDTFVELDWGDIMYKIDGRTYKFFYNGDIENPYDYLMVVDWYVIPNNGAILAASGRSPKNELVLALKIQNEVIEGIKYKVPKSKSPVSPGHFEVPSKQFWTDAAAFYGAFNTRISEYDASFIDHYGQEIGPDNGYDFESLPDRFMEGRATPYAFLKTGKIYFLANARRLNSVLFYGVDQLVQNSGINFPRPKLNNALYQFLDERFDDIQGPLIVAPRRHKESLEYAAAFISGKRLILVYTPSPLDLSEKQIEKVYETAEKDLASLSSNRNRILNVLKMQEVEWKTAQDEQPEPEILIVAPHLPTEFRSISLPPSEKVHYIFADEFYSIFDDFEQLHEYSSFRGFLEQMTGVFAMAREIDKYAAFKDTAGTLTQGARQPNLVALMGAMGGGHRYRHLKLLWDNYPSSGWGGDDIGAWGVDKSGQTRLYLKKDRYQNTFYIRAGGVDFFAMAPCHLFRDNMDEVKCVDLVCQIATDYFTRLPKLLKIKKTVPCDRLKVVVIPASLLAQPEFKGWPRPEGKPWAMDVGMMKANEVAIRVVVNPESFLQFSNQFTDNQLETAVMSDALSSLEPYAQENVKRMQNRLQQDSGKPKRFSIDRIERAVSFPMFEPSYVPGKGEYRAINNELAALAKENDIKPGKYKGQEAVEILNKLRGVVRKKLEDELSKFDLAVSIPIIISSLDALASERDIAKKGHKLSLARDIEFDVTESEAKSDSEFGHYARCTIYLVEKLMSLQVSSERPMAPSDLKRNLALVDRLLEIYSTSSIIKYQLITEPPKLLITNDYIIEIDDTKMVEKQNIDFSRENAQLALAAPTVPKVEFLDLDKELENTNNAFLGDYGFEFKNMGAVMALMSGWAQVASDGEKAYYKMGKDELITALKKQFTTEVGDEELSKILDFLTLDHERLVFLEGSKTPELDIPVWEHKKRPMRYMIRPLVKIGKQIYWGPYSIYRSLSLWQDILLTGNEPYRLPQDSSLKNVLDSIKATKEREIVEEAKAVVKELTDQVDSDVYLHKRDKAGGHPVDLGDYDVLAWLPKSKLLLNIECKYIVRANTHRDAFTQTENYFDDSKSPRYLNKVEKRQRYLRENMQKVMDVMGWGPSPEGATVVSKIVTNQLYNWMRYPLKQTDVIFMDIERLAVWARGMK